ncbi:MAG TPA: pentapeptide repeat-containing protein [Archangium sp.]
MSTLADLLRSGTDAFNARRAKGELPSDFSGSTLSGLFFAHADFSQLDLSDIEIEDCTIGGVDFTDANLEGAYVHGTRFERCDFSRAQFNGVSLERVDFIDCDFEGAKGLDAVEQDEVTGFNPVPVEHEEEEGPRFTPGHVAVNAEMEADLEAHPHDEKRWLVYADWLQGEGDLRGELIVRSKHEGFAEWVNDHLETIFPGCADEIRGGGQQPELALEWRHGLVVGATLEALNEQRRVDLGVIAKNLLALPVARFLERLSFGLISGATTYGGRGNDYDEVYVALKDEPALSRVKRLEFGVQEDPEPDEYGDVDPLQAFGDLTRFWKLLPRLRELTVKGGSGALGEVVLPDLRAVSWQIDDTEPDNFNELLAARHPKLERFELWDRTEVVEIEPLVLMLASLPLRHLALPFTPQVDVLLERLADGPLLRRLEVLDLSHCLLTERACSWMERNVAKLAHLKRLDLTDFAGPRTEDQMSALGGFVQFGPRSEEKEPERTEWSEDD